MMPAAMPSSTKVFLPVILPSLKTVATFSGLWCGPSSMASAPTTVPSAIFGSHSDFCASEPPRISALAAARPDDRSGEAVSVRPSSSRIRPSDR